MESCQLFSISGAGQPWSTPYPQQNFTMPAMPSAGYSSYNPYMGGYPQAPGGNVVSVISLLYQILNIIAGLWISYDQFIIYCFMLAI